MISKVKSLAARPKKDNSQIAAKQPDQAPSNRRSKSSPSNNVIVVNKPGTTIDITFKKTGRKSGSTMVSSRGSNAAKTVEEKKTAGGYLDTDTKIWSRTLREQNHPVVAQGVQQLASRLQSSNRHSRHENPERKEMKSMVETRESRNNIRTQNDVRILDDIPVKQPARRSSEHIRATSNSAIPSTTTIASSLDSIVVVDRGIQCGGIFDCSNDKFSVFNPVRMLGILMKEMEDLVRDERSSKILREMEQALMNIPTEPGKPSPADLKKVELGSKLEAGTAKLECTSKKIELACTKLREDKESLQQQVNKQALLLEEGQQRERNFEMTIKQMKLDMNEVLRSAAENRRVISILKEEKKSMEVAQKLATELRRDLNDQIELAQQRYMEIQYLKLEKEKLVALSTYKDSTLVELRKTLKELQNHITEQLVDIREAGKRVKDTSSAEKVSVIHGGVACSSPSSTSSKNSRDPQSCPVLSEISLSSVDCFSPSDARKDNYTSNNEMPVFSCSTGIFDDSGTKRNTDKTQLEFISLPGGETSRTISLSQQKDEEPIMTITSENKNGETTSNRKLNEINSAPNLINRDSLDSSRRLERDSKDHRARVKTRKLSSSPDKKQRLDNSKRASNNEDVKKAERCTGEPASIKEQFEMMFEDIRMQSKFPVRVPSPPRNYPRPDWSDSSLPTISGMSESNVA